MKGLFDEFKNVPIKPAPKIGQSVNFGETHKHPVTQTGKKHKIEKAYVSNSAGGEITEGCVDHYFDRIVDVEEEIEEKTYLDELLKDDITKYIIMGEILNKPKFRK